MASHDRAGALSAHHRELVLHRQPDALEIDADDLVPELLAERVDRESDGTDAGIVVGEVKPAAALDDLTDQLRDLVGDRHVAGHELRGATVGGDQLHGLLAAVAVTIDDGDVRPALGEQASGCAADARRRAGDEADSRGSAHRGRLRSGPAARWDARRAIVRVAAAAFSATEVILGDDPIGLS
jgi:hypothetical protein